MLPAINGRLKQQEGWFSLAQEVLTVSFGGFAPWCAAAFAKRLGATVQESQTGQIMLLRDDSLPPEAYVLTVTAEGIRVAKRHPRPDHAVSADGRAKARALPVPDGCTPLSAPRIVAGLRALLLPSGGGQARD